MSNPQITDLPGIGPASAEKLEEAGFETVLSIAVAHPSNIVDATGMSEKVSRKAIHAARTALDITFVNGLEAEKRDESKGFTIGTRCQALDSILGGGVMSGSITEVFGEFGCGKTQIAHQLCVNLYKKDNTAKSIYIDTENTFKPKRIRQMAEGAGVDPDKALESILVIQAFNSDHQMLLAEQAERHIKDKNAKMIIVDSLTAHFRAEYIGRGTLADRQQKINKHMHTLLKLAQMYDIVIFVTNQVSSNPGQFYGNPTQAIGGNIVAHNSATRISLRKGKTIKGEKSRHADLIDSPFLPDAGCDYFIREEGLVDID